METNQDKYVADIKEYEMLPESDRSLKYTFTKNQTTAFHDRTFEPVLQTWHVLFNSYSLNKRDDFKIWMFNKILYRIKKGMKTKVKVLFAVKTKRVTLNKLRASGGHWNNVVSPLRSETTMKCSCLEEISHF